MRSFILGVVVCLLLAALITIMVKRTDESVILGVGITAVILGLLGGVGAVMYADVAERYAKVGLTSISDRSRRLGERL